MGWYLLLADVPHAVSLAAYSTNGTLMNPMQLTQAANNRKILQSSIVADCAINVRGLWIKIARVGWFSLPG